MGERDISTKRRKALSWNAEPLIAAFLRANPSFTYREQFCELLLEAYHAFIAGCPRASIIVSGEALSRVLYDKIAQLLQTHDNIAFKARTKNKLDADMAHDLTEQLTLGGAVKLLRTYKVYSEELLNRMDAIIELRNRAAHRDLPVLDYWDSNDPRSEEELVELLQEGIEVPEGYRFMISKRDSTWVTIDLRNFNCGSLRELPVNDRFAAIQYLFVLEVMSEMNKAEKR